jgi:hypothetical protein
LTVNTTMYRRTIYRSTPTRHHGKKIIADPITAPLRGAR